MLLCLDFKCFPTDSGVEILVPNWRHFWKMVKPLEVWPNGRKSGCWQVPTNGILKFQSLFPPYLAPVFSLLPGLHEASRLLFLCLSHHRFQATGPSDHRLKPWKPWAKIEVFSIHVNSVWSFVSVSGSQLFRMSISSKTPG